jgi:large subunit ribosomal protein L10
MARPEKISEIAELKELFEGSTAFFVTDYQGLNVAAVTALRKSLRDNNVTFRVAKNTLLARAAKEAGVAESVLTAFTGPTAVAFSHSDPSVPAKVLHDSFKEKELPRMKVFVVESHVHNADQIKRLAELPSREILLSQLIAAIESPIQAVVGSIDAIFRDLVGTIDALADKRKTEG